LKEFYLRVDASRAPEALVALKGAMTSTEDSELLLRRATELLERGFTHFRIDLTNLEYVNSSGISTLISLRQSIESAGVCVAFTAPRQPLLRIFENLGLTEYFGIQGAHPGEKA